MIRFLARNGFIVVFIIVFVLSAILDKIFNIDDFLIRIAIVILVGFPLVPRKRKIDTQTGKKTQITWFLLKEPIFIDE